ncbi:MAG: hypothetical protein ACOX3K_00810 [Bacilli bacterium]|jgi:spermidine/putrescine-binding protein
MKQTKTLTKIILPALLALGSLAGCTGRKIEVDKTKSQVYVATFDGGFGDEYLESLKRRFEEEFNDVSYEEGKMGVELIYTKERNLINLDSYKSTIHDVIITEQTTYFNYVEAGDMLDITDIVKETLTEYGETRSIEDKIYNSSKNYLNIDGRYYALPYYGGGYGITYDRDFFSKNRLYFAGDAANEYRSAFDMDGAKKVFDFVRDDAGVDLCAGPNGIHGDYDDGLPQTIEQFAALAAQMAELGISPITMSGKNSGYIRNFLTALATNLTPRNEADLLFTLDGTSCNLIQDIANDGTITYMAETVITEENKNLTHRHSARYHALTVYEYLFKNNLFHSKINTSSHLEAQHHFINGTYKDRISVDDPIGFLIDGTWWENESAPYFVEMAERMGSDDAHRLNRNFALMPFPKLKDDQIGQKNIMFDPLVSLAFAINRPETHKQRMSKDLLRFMFSDASLSDFSRVTGTYINAAYDVNEKDLEELSPYTKSILQLKNDSEILFPLGSTQTYKDSQPAYLQSTFGWESNVDGMRYSTPDVFFKSKTVRSEIHNSIWYFKGIAINADAFYKS